MNNKVKRKAELEGAQDFEIKETDSTYIGDEIMSDGITYEVRRILATKFGGEFEDGEITLTECRNEDDDSTAYLILADGEVAFVEENFKAALGEYEHYEDDPENFKAGELDEIISDLYGDDDSFVSADAVYDSIGKQTPVTANNKRYTLTFTNSGEFIGTYDNIDEVISVIRNTTGEDVEPNDLEDGQEYGVVTDYEDSVTLWIAEETDEPYDSENIEKTLNASQDDVYDITAEYDDDPISQMDTNPQRNDTIKAPKSNLSANADRKNNGRVAVSAMKNSELQRAKEVIYSHQKDLINEQGWDGLFRYAKSLIYRGPTNIYRGVKEMVENGDFAVYAYQQFDELKKIYGSKEITKQEYEQISGKKSRADESEVWFVQYATGKVAVLTEQQIFENYIETLAQAASQLENKGVSNEERTLVSARKAYVKKAGIKQVTPIELSRIVSRREEWLRANRPDIEEGTDEWDDVVLGWVAGRYDSIGTQKTVTASKKPYSLTFTNSGEYLGDYDDIYDLIRAIRGATGEDVDPQDIVDGGEYGNVTDEMDSVTVHIADDQIDVHSAKKINTNILKEVNAEMIKAGR
jgi:hypothetical protein